MKIDTTTDEMISRLIARADRLIRLGREEDALPLLMLAEALIDGHGDRDN
jgi:hypothetical protein